MNGNIRKDRAGAVLVGDGIESEQRVEGWMLGAIGVAVVIGSVAASLLALPDALSKGEYSALFILLFVFIGIGLICYGIKSVRSYQRLGPTPLFLNPAVPSVGGQLGAQFSISGPDFDKPNGSAAQLRARVTCTLKNRGRNNTGHDVQWQEEAPVGLEQTDQGVRGSFLFDIPITCKSTQVVNRRSSIDWKVVVEGDFGDSSLGKFERSWKVIVQDLSAQVTHDATIQ